jgi:hypothetical protein
MSLHTILPPRRASSVANAAPMPLPAPVMTAAALRLRFSTIPVVPCRSPGRLVKSVVAQRMTRDVPHGGSGFRGQPWQRLEDVRLVGPDLQLPLAARRPAGLDERGRQGAPGRDVKLQSRVAGIDSRAVQLEKPNSVAGTDCRISA